MKAQVRVYQDIQTADYWTAWSANLGWMRFPAKVNGWAERKTIAALDPRQLREIPLAQAFQTGLLDAFRREAETA